MLKYVIFTILIPFSVIAQSAPEIIHIYSYDTGAMDSFRAISAWNLASGYCLSAEKKLTSKYNNFWRDSAPTNEAYKEVRELCEDTLDECLHGNTKKTAQKNKLYWDHKFGSVTPQKDIGDGYPTCGEAYLALRKSVAECTKKLGSIILNLENKAIALPGSPEKFFNTESNRCYDRSLVTLEYNLGGVSTTDPAFSQKILEALVDQKASVYRSNNVEQPFTPKAVFAE